MKQSLGCEGVTLVRGQTLRPPWGNPGTPLGDETTASDAAGRQLSRRAQASGW